MHKEIIQHLYPNTNTFQRESHLKELTDSGFYFGGGAFIHFKISLLDPEYTKGTSKIMGRMNTKGEKSPMPIDFELDKDQKRSQNVGKVFIFTPIDFMLEKTKRSSFQF